MNRREASMHVGAEVIYTSPIDPKHSENGVIESVGVKWVHVRYGTTVLATHPDNLTLVKETSHD